jgi:hypothetical protein
VAALPRGLAGGTAAPEYKQDEFIDLKDSPAPDLSCNWHYYDIGQRESWQEAKASAVAPLEAPAGKATA